MPVPCAAANALESLQAIFATYLAGSTCYGAVGLTGECQGAALVWADRGTMVGNVFLNPVPEGTEIDSPTNIHEQKHADRWAIYTLAGDGSPFGFITSYGSAEGMAVLGAKISGVQVKNPFECLADAGGGSDPSEDYCPGW